MFMACYYDLGANKSETSVYEVGEEKATIM